MTQAFATRMPRGFSWVGLAIVAVAFSASPLFAQTPPPTGGDKKPPVDPAKAEADVDDPTPAPTEEVFVDPNAKKALTMFNPLNYSGAPIKIIAGNVGDDRSKVQSMAAKQVNFDPDFLKRYVEYLAVELTKRDNLNAVLNPPATLKPQDAPARALERAVDALNKPLVDAKAKENDNKEFVREYNRILFESPLPKLLEPNNNYLTRIDAMIVLGMAGNPNPVALDLYANQLKRADQLIWVKLWAARGLTLAAQHGSFDLDAGKANQAAEALIALLDSDPKLPWPVQMRALEALGSLRVATANTAKGKIDAASVAMRFLADPEASPMVRSWAAWALGTLKVSSAVSPYNFSLIGQEVGELTIDLGNRIVQEYDEDPAHFDQEKDVAAQFTSLLLFQVCPTFIGVEGVRDSGLLRSPHKNAGDSKAFLAKVDDRVKAVTRSAYELLKSAGTGNKAARNELDAKLADLKVFLSTTSPKDRHLVPGGPEFAPTPAQQVAGAAGP